MSNLSTAHAIAHSLTPILHSLHDRAGAAVVKAGRQFIARVGDGASTNHFFKTADQCHVITLGAKMVESKMSAAGAEKWLSAREIRKFRFFNGEVTFVNLLAHTIMHEYGHMHQHLEGGRTRGSVHNDCFYRILAQLHREHGEFVLSKVNEVFATYNFDREFQQAPKLTLTETLPPIARNPASDPAGAFKMFDRVSFEFRGSRIVGKIIKKNPVRAKVETVMGVILVPYSMMTTVNEDDDKTPVTAIQAITLGQVLRRPDFRRNQSVIFDHKGRPVRAKVISCNQKTVTVETDFANEKWRIPYSRLRAA